MRIGLVGCVKTKLHRPAQAKDLYISPLFRGRRRYVERNCDRWFILSAKHGLLEPDSTIEPYDLRLSDCGAVDRRRWSRGALEALEAKLGELGSHTFELHA